MIIKLVIVLELLFVTSINRHETEDYTSTYKPCDRMIFIKDARLAATQWSVRLTINWLNHHLVVISDKRKWMQQVFL